MVGCKVCPDTGHSNTQGSIAGLTIHLIRTARHTLVSLLWCFHATVVGSMEENIKSAFVKNAFYTYKEFFT